MIKLSICRIYSVVISAACIAGIYHDLGDNLDYTTDLGKKFVYGSVSALLAVFDVPTRRWANIVLISPLMSSDAFAIKNGVLTMFGHTKDPERVRYVPYRWGLRAPIE